MCSLGYNGFVYIFSSSLYCIQSLCISCSWDWKYRTYVFAQHLSVWSVLPWFMLMIFKYYFLVIFLFCKKKNSLDSFIYLSFMVLQQQQLPFAWILFRKSILFTFFLFQASAFSAIAFFSNILSFFRSSFFYSMKVIIFGRKDKSFCCLSHSNVANTMRIFISTFNFHPLLLLLTIISIQFANLLPFIMIILCPLCNIQCHIPMLLSSASIQFSKSVQLFCSLLVCV